MTKNEILEKLRSLGTDQTKRVLIKHGAREPVFGVKVEDLKKIQKTEKGNNKLAMELFQTGNCDAMYLAGLIADGSKMSPDAIGEWADAAYGFWISEFTVPWVATENKAGYDLAKAWIRSEVENIAATGWSTFSSIVAVWPDDQLDHLHLKSLLQQVEQQIHKAPNRVRYTMNGFVIAVGCYVPALMDDCLAAAGNIGPVKVEMHGTACKVPQAADYILKASKMGRTGRKRKKVKC